MNKFLVIQTAFIGDVILSTAVIEKLAKYYPQAQIDILVRQDNESLLLNNPHINKVLVWNKKDHKYRKLMQTLRQVRRQRYDFLINLHRFMATGLIAAYSHARQKTGFTKNPLAFCYDYKFPHRIENKSDAPHEVQRNQQLIAHLTDDEPAKPRLYPAEEDYQQVPQDEKYICIAPTSVWYTKQWPADQWIAFINLIPADYTIYLLGAKADRLSCNSIKDRSKHPKVINRAGELSFLQSAALMQHAEMNYANDSAPLHIASAMNAPVTAIFCSTVPEFGFAPLSDDSAVIQTSLDLPCRPCGVHGHQACPEKHYRCSNIDPVLLSQRLD